MMHSKGGISRNLKRFLQLMVYCCLVVVATTIFIHSEWLKSSVPATTSSDSKSSVPYSSTFRSERDSRHDATPLRTPRNKPSWHNSLDENDAFKDSSVVVGKLPSARKKNTPKTNQNIFALPIDKLLSSGVDSLSQQASLGSQNYAPINQQSAVQPLPNSPTTISRVADLVLKIAQERRLNNVDELVEYIKYLAFEKGSPEARQVLETVLGTALTPTDAVNNMSYNGPLINTALDGVPQGNTADVGPQGDIADVGQQVNTAEGDPLDNNAGLDLLDNFKFNGRKATAAELAAENVADFTAGEGFGPDEAYFSPSDKVVNAFDSEWLIKSSPCPAGGVFLLVLVPSLDVQWTRRQTIRDTWASAAYGNTWPGFNEPWDVTVVKVVFVLGVSKSKDQDRVTEMLKLESRVYGDTVRANFTDIYVNLSFKMMIALRWVTEFCPAAKYVLKVDQDTFVNTLLLMDTLDILGNNIRTDPTRGKGRSRFVLGHRHHADRPEVVRKGNNWAVSKEIYSPKYFPRYLYGHSYVISGDAVGPLFDVARRMPLVPNEDAYITGILARTAHVQRLTSELFAVNIPVDRCLLVKDKAITQTQFGKDDVELRQVWDMFNNNGCKSRHYSLT